MKIEYSDKSTPQEPKELQKKALEYVEEKGGKATSYINSINNVFIIPRGVETEQMMRDLAEYWTKAVIISADDTGGTGTATLYEKDIQYGDHNAWPRDKYTEMQHDQSDSEGSKAATYMMFAHDVECDPYHRMKWTDNEKKVGYEDPE